MEFYYSGSIEALKTFYLSMRKINIAYQIMCEEQF